MKPIRSVYNHGVFYGVKRFDWSAQQTVWLDGRRMDGTHISDAILFARRSTAERHAKKHGAEAVEVLQTLVGRCVVHSTKETAKT
jgi:hypothetical protein